MRFPSLSSSNPCLKFVICDLLSTNVYAVGTFIIYLPRDGIKYEAVLVKVFEPESESVPVIASIFEILPAFKSESSNALFEVVINMRSPSDTLAPSSSFRIVPMASDDILNVRSYILDVVEYDITP